MSECGEVMNMFSKELAQLDKNTVHYMIYEMQNEIDDMKRQMEEKDDTMNSIVKKIRKSPC